jgi:Ni/Co efflux regulator RcnB
MKRLLTASAALLMATTAVGSAMAAPGYGYGYRHDNRYDRSDRYERHDDRYDRSDRYDRRQGWRADWREGRRMDRDYWYRAQRVDWRTHHLRRPPYGYEWRYVDGRYVLAAVATGLIASIIIGNSRY